MGVSGPSLFLKFGRGTALQPRSEAEKALLDLEREIRVEQNRQWHEQRRVEREYAEAEAKAEAERQAAIVAAQAREKANLENRERLAAQARDRDIATLRIRTAQQQAWAANVDRAANIAVRQRYSQTLMDELEKMLSPPEPPPEPEQPVYVEREEDDGRPALHRWFEQR